MLRPWDRANLALLSTGILAIVTGLSLPAAAQNRVPDPFNDNQTWMSTPPGSFLNSKPVKKSTAAVKTQKPAAPVHKPAPATRSVPAKMAQPSAQSMGQSDWVSPQGQSNWSNSQDQGQMGQSQMGQSQMGQSDWVTPAGSSQGQSQMGQSQMGQSDWVTPAGSSQGQSQMSQSQNQMGQSDWVNPSAGNSQGRGQSQWQTPSGSNPSNSSFGSATKAPLLGEVLEQEQGQGQQTGGQNLTPSGQVFVPVDQQGQSGLSSGTFNPVGTGGAAGLLPAAMNLLQNIMPSGQPFNPVGTGTAGGGQMIMQQPVQSRPFQTPRIVKQVSNNVNRQVNRAVNQSVNRMINKGLMNLRF